MQELLERPTADMTDTTKKCPFCAELIQAEAIKCRHCGEFFVKPPKKKWYDSNATLIVMFLLVGPLAIPLAWRNPRYSLAAKILITLVMMIATIVLVYAIIALYANMLDQIRQLGINF